MHSQIFKIEKQTFTEFFCVFFEKIKSQDGNLAQKNFDKRHAIPKSRSQLKLIFFTSLKDHELICFYNNQELFKTRWVFATFSL